MRTTVTTAAPDFTHITVNLTVENAAEARALYAIANISTRIAKEIASLHNSSLTGSVRITADDVDTLTLGLFRAVEDVLAPVVNGD